MKLTQLEKDKIDEQAALIDFGAQQHFIEQQEGKDLIKTEFWWPRKDLGKVLRFQARLCLEHERSLKR